jgi:hypothetical protein
MRPPRVISNLIPPELEGRITLTAHDFFTQTITADIYYCRWIFHNWSDVYAIKILKNLVPALKLGAKILINDGILPEPGTIGVIEEKSIRQVVAKGTEFNVAHGFKTMDLLQFVTKPEKSHMWLNEAIWMP